MSDAQAANHTALQCLAIAARHHGIDLAPERLVHDYAVGEVEPPLPLLLRMAQDNGLRARDGTLTFADLTQAGQSFPMLARLTNGNWVILAGIRPDPDGPKVAVLDPLSSTPDLLFLEPERFVPRWSGTVMLLKRAFKVTDENQPFGIAWFIPEILRQKKLFRDVGLAAVLLHVLALALPIFLQLVIDKVLVHESYSTLYVLAAGICFAIVFEAIFSFLRRYLLLYASSKIDVRVATRTFAHLLRLPIDFFDRGSAGVLVKHMQQAERVREFLTGRLFLTLLDATALFVFIPVLMLYSLHLTAVVVVFTLLTAGVIGLLIKPFQRRLRALYEAEGERQSLLVEAIHGMRTIKALALEPKQRRRWDRTAANAVSMHFRVGRISTTAQALTQFLEKLMLIAIIGIGAQLVFDGTITVGALVAFNMLAGRVSAPLVQLVTLVHEYQEAALSVRMLGNVMNQRPEGTGARGVRPPIRGRIEFEGVTFRYGPEGAPALDDVSFKIPSGSVFGLVGRSGSGKTTVTRLIQGLYARQEGMIRLDGLDIREIDLQHLRQSTGTVLQDNFLFRGTVRENIAVGKPDATFEEVVEAARLAGAQEFIEHLPRGFDTLLEENASNLSGGQKQRLAIARALITQPRILILDEATSALDPESEVIVRRNLRDIARDRTLIVVSHRLSFIADADQILVLDKGKVSGLGRHDQLLQSCDIYKTLWSQQNLLVEG